MKSGWLWSLLVIVVMPAAPAAADQWYEHYARAEQALIDSDYATAVAELNQAIARRGDSGARVRTYGMRVVDYFPYLKLGIAYFASGEFEAALRAFDTEEQLGAIQGSEDAMGELSRFRRRATQALQQQRDDKQLEIEGIVRRNLDEAAGLRQAGRLEEAAAAVDRALALAPESREGLALAAELRDEIARRDDERRRLDRASQLIAEGRRLADDGRNIEAAARFRQAAELAPESAAGELLAAVQGELAGGSESAPAIDVGGALGRAGELADGGALEEALGLVQQILAAIPGDPRATELETRLLSEIAQKQRSDEISRLLREADGDLERGDLEAALAAANLVLARESGNSDALGIVQRAYAALSRRLLGEGPAQNLPPAIRFAGRRSQDADGVQVDVVRDPVFRVTGVVIDESEVVFEATDGMGSPVPAELSTQSIGGVLITEFTLETKLASGVTTLVVDATDDEGLSSRSEYAVEYRPPLFRLPWFWGALAAVAVLAAAAVAARRTLRRRRLMRRRFNPFVAGPPVLDPGLFIGRDELIDRVLATVPNNSLLLLGERRIGKTSMLYQLRSRLPDLDHPRFCFVPVPIDLQGVAEDDFFATVAEAVGEAVGDETMTAARAADGYDSRELMRDLRRLLPTVSCPDGRQAKVVLLLDEIDELNGYSHRTNQRLRSLFMRGFADQLVAVAAGVGIAREWDHEGSPWYNFFEELEVGPLDADAARRLVTGPLGGVIAIDDEAVDRLLREAEGRPYILQKLALAVVQRLHEDGRSRITSEDVEAVAES